MRADLAIIAEWIKPRSSILDLGCGDGTLLKQLRDQQSVRGIGLEIDERNIEICLENNLNIIQSDLNNGLQDYFSDNSFDYVIMSQTLQATKHPEQLIDEMLRVGKEGIITFPNMAHWKARLQLALGGHMPVTKSLPNRWYNTPNIHLELQRRDNRTEVSIATTLTISINSALNLTNPSLNRSQGIGYCQFTIIMGMNA